MGFRKNKEDFTGPFASVKNEKDAIRKMKKEFAGQEVFSLTGRTVKRGSGFADFGQ